VVFGGCILLTTPRGFRSRYVEAYAVQPSVNIAVCFTTDDEIILLLINPCSL